MYIRRYLKEKDKEVKMINNTLTSSNTTDLKENVHTGREGTPCRAVEFHDFQPSSPSPCGYRLYTDKIWENNDGPVNRAK